MRVEDLFPPCSDKRCPEYGEHKHLLPHQQATLDAEEKYVALVGGYGSAKTSVGAAIGILLSLSVPGNLGLVGRLTYSRLEDAIIPVWLQMLERADIDYQPRQFFNGLPRQITFANQARVMFRELKHIERVQSMELGWFVVEE